MKYIWIYSHGLYYIVCGLCLLLISTLLACKVLADQRKSSAAVESSGMDNLYENEETQLLADSDLETELLDDETILLERY